MLLVKADDCVAPIRRLGEISPRTRLGDTLSGDWDTSLVNRVSSADSAIVDKVAMLPVRVSEIAKQRNAAERQWGDEFRNRKETVSPWPNHTRWVRERNWRVTLTRCLSLSSFLHNDASAGTLTYLAGGLSARPPQTHDAHIVIIGCFFPSHPRDKAHFSYPSAIEQPSDTRRLNP